MTRIIVSGPHGDQSECELTIAGHTNPEACAALSALWESFIFGIKRLERLHPNDIKIFEPATEV